MKSALFGLKVYSVVMLTALSAYVVMTAVLDLTRAQRPRREPQDWEGA